MGKTSSIWKGLRLTLNSPDVQRYEGNPAKLSSSIVRTNYISLISSISDEICRDEDNSTDFPIVVTF